MNRKKEMEIKGQSQRHQSTSIPSLVKSRSGTSSSSSSDQNQIMSTKKSNPKEGVQQLKRCSSTTKSTTLKERFQQQRIHESKDDNLKMLQRTQTKIEVQRKTRSACTSPSAWALSSGRSSPSPSTTMSVVKPRGALSPGRGARQPSGFSPVISVPKSPSSGKLLGRKNSGGKVLSGFWNFLKQKKASPEEEEVHHQFRLMQTRLVQWRFASARAEDSMNVMKRVAQKKLFNVWLRNSIIRNHNVEKRIQIQKIKHEIKLSKILNSQFDLLKEWSRLEGKNSEALGRLSRKLSAISTCLPLVNGAKADVTSMYESLTNAMRVLEGIKLIIANKQSQIETMCYMLTELIIFLKEQEGYVKDLEKTLTTFLPLEVKGESLSVHCIQLLRESKRIEGC